MTVPGIEKCQEQRREVGKGAKVISPDEILNQFEVRDEYVEQLGKEEFLYSDLIIRQHIVTIIAQSGGGKTTFLYYHVAPHLAKKGLKVWYIDADSPASEHKKMKEFAKERGFKFLIPDVNQGTSVEKLINSLVSMAETGENLRDYVFVFDTLKKFIDLMSKKSAKEFFVLMRRLTKLGATVALPGHANKHRDADGNLVFEGVGDIRSDSDDLIFFEKTKKHDDSMDVTTVVDSDRGAKVRGLFKPFSFNVSPSREITFYKEALTLADSSNTGVPKATDDEILNTAEDYIKSCGKPVSQSQLVQYVVDKVEGLAGKNRVRKIIVKRSVQAGNTEPAGTRFLYTVGKRNSHSYELPKEVQEQRSLWGEEESSFLN